MRDAAPAEAMLAAALAPDTAELIRPRLAEDPLPSPESQLRLAAAVTSRMLAHLAAL